MRQKIIGKFEKILNKDTSKLIENNIYSIVKQKYPHLNDTDPEFNLEYLEKCRSIYENLNTKSYFDTSETKDKKIDFAKIGTLDLKTLRYKGIWKRIKQNQEVLDKNLMDLKPTTETDQFLCKKCKNRKTTFYTMQIRSADEAETSFITCLVCNYSWREG